MKRLLSVLTTGATVAFVVSCGQATSDSKGHFERFDASKAAAFIGTQRVRAEYQPASGVIVSSVLFDEYHFTDLGRQLLDTGITSLIVATERTNPKSLANLSWSFLSKYANRVTLLPSRTAGSASVWARDWAPLTAIGNPGGPNAGKTVALDFNYYTKRPLDDAVPTDVELSVKVPRVSVPVYNEGGNFMTTSDGRCMMSERVVEANTTPEIHSDVIMDADAIKDAYVKFAGCREVTIFPRLPYEGTGHIDMWSKLLSDDTVLVARMDDRTISTIYNTALKFQAGVMSRFLDARAVDFENMGFKVVRIPMPAPTREVTRSYTNSLILNGVALVPVYRDKYAGYGDRQLISQYEREVEAAYTAAGFKYVPVESSPLIENGGAIHCVTMQFGAM